MTAPIAANDATAPLPAAPSAPGAVGDLVADVPGLYGPTALPETFLQQLWLRREYAAEGLVTQTGQSLQVVRPGRWNRLGGPDFRESELRLDGELLVGDVEIHLYAEDWFAHGHHLDPAYQNVVLHVVLFPPTASDRPALTAAARFPQVLVWLPHLRQDLEAAAAEADLRAQAARDPVELAAPLLLLPVADRRARFAAHARQRWRWKLVAARQRAEAAPSWSAALHRAVLESLGGAANRGAMAQVATAYPPDLWADPTLTVEVLLATPGARWSLRGVRPAGHPRVRLGQLLALYRAQPDWPSRWWQWARALPSLAVVQTAPAEGEAVPAPALLRATRSGWAELLAPAGWGADRQATLLVDALLPLAAGGGQPALPHLAPWWHSWPAGESPPPLSKLLRLAEVAPPGRRPTNGELQGALQYTREHETGGPPTA